mgnify:CR=1 FL=1
MGLGIHVVMTAHAKMRKFEQPDELGAYDRWEMKLTKQTAPMVKEWADMVLFANYKTFVVNVDGQGAQKGKNKAQGGRRVMFTTHHPCWDAKNRYGLPEELPFDYGEIAAILADSGNRPTAQEEAPVQMPKRPAKPSTPEPPTPVAAPEDQSLDLPPFMHQETMRKTETREPKAGPEAENPATDRRKRSVPQQSFPDPFRKTSPRPCGI